MKAKQTNPQKTDSNAEQVFLKLRNYCVYQERSQLEVRLKCKQLGIKKELTETLLVKLLDENFLNEERFAMHYAGGKFRIKKWGKIKIKQGLLQKGISTYCIKRALAAIPNSEYQATLKKLLAQKSKLLHESNPLKKKNQLQKFALSKGFEGYLVNELLGEEEDF
jgi:regulatory protein